MVVIASVLTFSVHMMLGYDLTAAQVNTNLINNTTLKRSLICKQILKPYLSTEEVLLCYPESDQS